MSPFNPVRPALAGALSLTLLALSACGSGSGDVDGTSSGADPDGAAAVVDEQVTPGGPHGQVIVTEAASIDGAISSRAAARFVSLDPAAADRTAMLERALDTCGPVMTGEVSSAGSGGSASPGSSEDFVSTPFHAAILPIDETFITSDVDAGGAIVLTGPDGTWATLVDDQAAPGSAYRSNTGGTGIDGRVPSGLVIDIPGDGDFPTFSTVAMPDPQPGGTSFVPEPGSPVVDSTIYQWAANDVTGSRVRIAVDMGDGRRWICFAADDGLFTLAEAMDDVPALPAGSTLASVSRESTRIERDGDATLVLTVSTGSP